MKLRRALTSVAVTAALTPAALFTATSAFADGNAPVTTQSSSATSSESATPTQTPSATVSATPSDTATATASATPTKSADPGVTSSASPGDGPADGADCLDSDDDVKVDSKLTSSLIGLPSKIAAGSGWHGFTFHVANSSDASYKRVDFAVFAAQLTSDWDADTSHLKLQFQNPDTGSWEAISLDESDPGAGYLGFTDVQPHDSFSLKLRLSVDASAPAGEGYALAVGVYVGAKGECVISDGDLAYEFKVTAAGSSSGGSDSKPTTGGQKPLPAKPAGNTEISSNGDLAETGSSSALPAIAAIGGVVMAVGAGAIFVVRRRTSHSG